MAGIGYQEELFVLQTRLRDLESRPDMAWERVAVEEEIDKIQYKQAQIAERYTWALEIANSNYARIEAAKAKDRRLKCPWPPPQVLASKAM